MADKYLLNYTGVRTQIQTRTIHVPTNNYRQFKNLEEANEFIKNSGEVVAVKELKEIK